MAQPDIFNNPVQTGNTRLITSQEMLLSISSGSNFIGALVQNIQIQYSQPVQIIREVGSKKFYLFALPPQGNVSFGRLVASDKTILDVIKKVSGNDPWSPRNNGQRPMMVLTPVAEAGTSGLSYAMSEITVENFGVNADSSSQFLQENVSIKFGNLFIG